MTQSDLCVLALNAKGGWRRAYELERYTVSGEMVGSEADTRLYELFDKSVPDSGSVEVVIEGNTYTVETKKTGGERWWKAYVTAMKPIRKIVPVILPDGTRAVREVIETPEVPKPVVRRTDRQNRAMHLWLTQLAETLNQAGLDQRKVLKPSVAIPWTQEACKSQLWKPIQDALFNKDSTTELSKVEVGKVEEVLTRHLQEKFGVEIPPWPHFETEEEFVKSTI